MSNSIKDMPESAAVQFPNKAFLLTITVTAILLLGLLWQRHLSDKTFADDLRILTSTAEDSEKAIYYDEALTMSAYAASLTGDASWVERYNSFAKKLDELLLQIKEETPRKVNDLFIEKTSKANDVLLVLEGKVLKLSLDHRGKEARAIIESDEYRKQKKIYSDGLIEFRRNISYFARQKQEQLADSTRKMVIVSVICFFLIMGGWVNLYTNLRTVYQQNIDFQGNLERNVEQRTAELNERTMELEQAAGRLAAENEERLRLDARTRLILNSAGEGIVGVDAEERVTFLNDAATALLGYSADEVIGSKIHPLIHHSYADGTPYARENCPMFHACTHGEVRNITGEVLWRKDGTPFPSEYSVTPISDGKGGSAGAVMVFHDITERKNSEEELRLRMEEMEGFNRLIIGREERMIQLKLEVNALLGELGREKKYRPVDEELK